MAERVLNRRTELILIFDSKNAISRQFENSYFERGTLDDLWQIKIGKKITNSHSAVFPEELVKIIIDNFSKTGDLVYDPLMGTGTTAVVAKKLKRNFIGSEITKKYYDLSIRRLEEIENELFI